MCIHCVVHLYVRLFDCFYVLRVCVLVCLLVGRFVCLRVGLFIHVLVCSCMLLDALLFVPLFANMVCCKSKLSYTVCCSLRWFIARSHTRLFV